MNDELMNVMEEVADEAIPATQAIMEEAIAPAAEAIAQETIPAIETALEKADVPAKHSGLKTVGLIVALAGIVLIKPAKKLIKNQKNKAEAKQKAKFNAWYDERRAAEIAAEKDAAISEATATDTTDQESDEAPANE